MHSVSSGHLEQIFSQLKLIKSDRRSRLGEDNLDSLLRIKVDAPPLAHWDATGAVNLWWKDKTRRVVKDSSAATPPTQTEIIQASTSTSSCASTSLDSSQEDAIFSLEDWEIWLNTYILAVYKLLCALIHYCLELTFCSSSVS